MIPKTISRQFSGVAAKHAKIAIVGSGPSGLVLARLLQVNKIPCTVFESDKNQHARTQGGSLDLHEGSGQRALKEAGLFDAFMKHARPEGETLRIFGPNDEILLDESRDASAGRPEEMHGRPEIDRVLLRDLLLDSLQKDSMKWDHRLRSVEETDAQQYVLHFENGTKDTFDCVVGADGAWSKVRPVVTPEVPFFSGITGIDIQISEPDARQPHLAERVGKGMCLNLGENKGILTQRNGDASIRIYALMRATQNWHKECGIDFSQPDAAKEAFVSANFNDWSQEAKELILNSDPDVVPRPIYMLPIGLKWEHRPGATLIGDAAHLMCPFAGVGVNAAMEDSLELAQSIIEQADGALSTAIQHYEEKMFVRAEEYAKQSWMFLNIFFNERGGAAMMDHFAERRAQEQAAKQE